MNKIIDTWCDSLFEMCVLFEKMKKKLLMSCLAIKSQFLYFKDSESIQSNIQLIETTVGYTPFTYSR